MFISPQLYQVQIANLAKVRMQCTILTAPTYGLLVYPLDLGQEMSNEEMRKWTQKFTEQRLNSWWIGTKIGMDGTASKQEQHKTNDTSRQSATAKKFFHTHRMFLVTFSRRVELNKNPFQCLGKYFTGPTCLVTVYRIASIVIVTICTVQWPGLYTCGLYLVGDWFYHLLSLCLLHHKAKTNFPRL